jgi:transposase
MSDTFPAPVGLRVEAAAVDGSSLSLALCNTAPTAQCPGCGVPSARVHSRYTRRPADLPGHGRATRLLITIRRFFCPTEGCPRKTFAEQLPGLVAPHARSTMRLDEAHAAIGHALGGQPGARLATKLAMPVSPDTLLRRVRRDAPATGPTPCALGVDEFAFRKGARYGTILVDLERRRVIDLLPDREATTVAAWLRARPGVEVVSRDRAAAYAQAAGEAAPDAVQVADRWHLMKNAREVAERVLQRRAGSVRALLGARRDRPGSDGPGSDPVRPQPEETPRQEVCSPKREERLARFERVRQMHRDGVWLRGIARTLGMNYQTVERYVRSDACPDWQPGRHRPSRLDRFDAYIRRRLAEGCGNARQVLRELHAAGFRGGRTVVQERVRLLKAEAGISGAPSPVSRDEPGPTLPSFWRLAVTIVRSPDERDEEDRAAIAALCAGDVVVREMSETIEGFASMIRERRPGDLAAWSDRAKRSSVTELGSFARRLSQDEAAVRSGIGLAWSNGPVEGHVNRLKAIKRSMFGRARFDLLRARVLAAG